MLDYHHKGDKSFEKPRRGAGLRGVVPKKQEETISGLYNIIMLTDGQHPLTAKDTRLWAGIAPSTA